ncbi:hypothetical protein GCM10010840_22730 [Deinococcus aerolatus]|uniref:Lipoprotein n=2 Tax=Deinococcus aerolatus TaxID=522487 RepID=A0ABQ2GBV4_9DEIO|nr:hypothetical protein GCM10010840_22730 [Deinococcus aerolatus]
MLIPVALLIATSLASCAPAATEPGSRSTSTGTAGAPAPRYAFKPGQVWTISGLDQNRNTFRSTITLTAAAPKYRRGDGWYYDGDNGYINLFEVERGTNFEVWDVSDSRRLVLCYVRQSYSETQDTYAGIALAGTREEIDGLFAKLSTVYGGSCRVTRS